MTVATADLVMADVFATAAVAMGPDRAVRWLRRQRGVLAVVVTECGELIEVGDRAE